MKKKYLETLILGAVVVLLLTGSLFASETDRRIESAVQKSYVFQNYLKDDNIEVHAKNGIVTLTGTVSNEDHKIMAEDTVSDLPGVKGVDNQLQVKGEVLEKNSDAWIRTRINMILRLHSNLDADNTQVEVKDGVVTLRGEADSEAQKALTTEYAKDVEGVKDVNNEMTVIKEPKPKHRHRTVGEFIDDSSIKAQVKSALLFHHGTSPFRARVSVKKGVVTVTGTAKNEAEKELVTKRIEDIHGVKKINNLMVVK